MKNKQLFTIKLEAMVPTTLVYTVEAENEKDALKHLETNSSNLRCLNIKPKINKKFKLLTVKVYQGRTSMMKLSKTYNVI